jgi:hypothetical protein
MVIRTYFDRNNTLVYNRSENTGKNPVAELFYGGNTETNQPFFTRYIFQFDVQRIIDLRVKGKYPDLSKLKHTLRMTNTGTFDESLLGQQTGDGKDRTSSFDLNLFTVNEPWDEGVGYDFAGQKYFSFSDATVLSNEPSNWVDARTGTPWPEGAGTFSAWTGVTIVQTQSFEDGTENLEMDITDLVNGYLTGATNNGLGLAFDEGFENTVTDNLQYVGFFTRHTQTFYEPYVETTYSDFINDDRADFYMDKLNKLYLYVNVGGVPCDVDDINTLGVNILDEQGETFSAITSSGITKEDVGVYSIELQVPTTSAGCVLYEDVWTGVTINGVTRPPIELEFELKDSMGYYNIGAEPSTPRDYKFFISGIKDGEKIKRGDIRKIRVNARVPFTVNDQEVLTTLEYRLYTKEGQAEYSVIDYQPINKAFNYNYFLLDTESLLPTEYFLDIKATSDYEVRTTKNVVSFEITSQVDERKG